MLNVLIERSSRSLFWKFHQHSRWFSWGQSGGILIDLIVTQYIKSTTDQIFTLRQILKKTHEKQVGAHHLFVDYKTAFDSPIRDRVYTPMSELSTSAKLTRLCRMMLSNFCSYARVRMDLSEPFDDVRSFRQGDPLTCDLFNFVMESVLQKAQLCYFSKKHPVACVRWRHWHHRVYQKRCNCFL